MYTDFECWTKPDRADLRRYAAHDWWDAAGLFCLEHAPLNCTVFVRSGETEWSAFVMPATVDAVTVRCLSRKRDDGVDETEYASKGDWGPFVLSGAEPRAEARA